MKIVLEGIFLFSIASTLCFADTWTGRLIDATCTELDKSNIQTKDAGACAPQERTVAFAIQTSDGKIYKLDSSGNAKAAEFFKASKRKADIDVTIGGSISGQTLKVDSLNVSTETTQQPLP
jgi:hypothetical protein